MNTIETLEKIIHDRHTVKAAKMNGKIIPDEQIEKLLQLADEAPTHKLTEPWRFWVYSGEALKEFGEKHAKLYWEHTEEGKRKEAKKEKLIRYAENASHLIIAVMKRTEKSRIPEFEEIAAVSAAIEHILLGATAMEMASFWNTGGMATHDSVKDLLGLKKEDRVLGFLYLGYTDRAITKRKRRVALKEKVCWKK